MVAAASGTDVNPGLVRSKLEPCVAVARFADAAPAGKVLASELLELLAEQGPERGIRPPQCQFAAVHFDALLACAVSANDIRIAIAAWPRDNDRLQSIGGAARSLKIETPWQGRVV